MGETIISFVTVSCDGPGCDKTATFPNTEQDGKEAFQNNPWMHSIRTVQTVDGRKFVYCSDECIAKAVGTGILNKQTIVKPQAPNAVQLAAQAAARAQQATQALKSGGPVTLE